MCVSPAEQMFWEVMQLRREMSLAKLGYYKDQLWPTVQSQQTPPSPAAPPLLLLHPWIWFTSSLCECVLVCGEGRGEAGTESPPWRRQTDDDLLVLCWDSQMSRFVHGSAPTRVKLKTWKCDAAEVKATCFQIFIHLRREKVYYYFQDKVTFQGVSRVNLGTAWSLYIRCLF